MAERFFVCWRAAKQNQISLRNLSIVPFLFRSDTSDFLSPILPSSSQTLLECLKAFKEFSLCFLKLLKLTKEERKKIQRRLNHSNSNAIREAKENLKFEVS
jgi:hypothetical protein